MEKRIYKYYKTGVRPLCKPHRYPKTGHQVPKVEKVVIKTRGGHPRRERALAMPSRVGVDPRPACRETRARKHFQFPVRKSQVIGARWTLRGERMRILERLIYKRHARIA